ncbi:MAG TPA: type II toxin-antitoxin system VapC family toxin [Nakamurella sp.]
MIVDTSAVIAVLADEPDRRLIQEAIDGARVVQISVASYLEAALVIDNRMPRGEMSPELDRFLRWARASIEPVTVTQATLARSAHRRFGRGSGHPARLNYADCFAYALAVDAGEPLLFKGDDFARTDVLRALPPTGG